MTNIGFRILPAPKRLDPMHRGDHMVGVALTVRVCPGDNLMVHKAIDMAQPGDVIVVAAGGDLSQAIIGEIMSTLAAKRGCAGMVIDGAIRDSGALATSKFPVYARGVTHRGPYKNGPGEINVPVSIGGMVVNPGDIIVGDDDGVVALGQDIAAIVLKAAKAKAKDEDAMLKAIRKGGKVDRNWVDQALRTKGCDF
jgi:regulator of RNase E activity RraA